MSKIPECYLNVLISKNNLSETPISVRRQAWLLNKEYFIRSIEETLVPVTPSSTTTKANVATTSNVAMATDVKSLEINCKKMCEMIQQSEVLLQYFSDFCSTKCKNTAYSSIVTIPLNSQETSMIQDKDENKNTAMFPPRYYAGLLMKVYIGSQEEGLHNKIIPAFEKLHELAIILDRSKRQGKIEVAAVSDIYQLFKSIIIVRAAIEEKKVVASKPIIFNYTNKSQRKYKRTNIPQNEKKRKAISVDLGLGLGSLGNYSKYKNTNTNTSSHRNNTNHRRMKLDTYKIDKFITHDNDEECEAELSSNDNNSSSEDDMILQDSDNDMNHLDDDSNSDDFPRRKKKKIESEEDTHITIPTIIPTQILEPILIEAIDSLQKIDKELGEFFKYPVTDEIAPNYSKIIEYPMDLSTMLHKMRKLEYLNISSLHEDVLLMCKNCNVYNKGTFLSDIADRFSKSWSYIYNKLKVKLRTKLSVQATSHIHSRILKKNNNNNNNNKLLPKSSMINEYKLLSKKLQVILNQLMSIDDDTIHNKNNDKIDILLYKVFPIAIEFLCATDDKEIFLKPVSDSIAPGYSTLIKHPIAINSMRTKIKKSSYQTMKEFSMDVALIVTNCLLFNANNPNKIYVNCATKLQSNWNIFELRVKELFPQLFEPCEQLSTIPSTDITTNDENGIDLNKNTFDIKEGLYNEGSYIALPYILTTSKILSNIPNVDKDIDVYDKNALKSSVVHRSIMNLIWNYLSDIDYNCTFHNPVPLEVLHYYSIIKNPMDLSSIKFKIDRKKYKFIDEFNNDVQLMLNNCFQFNQTTSDFYYEAERLRFAMYLVDCNVRSILEIDPSLAIHELPEEHLEIMEENAEEGEVEFGDTELNNIETTNATTDIINKDTNTTINTTTSSIDIDTVDKNNVIIDYNTTTTHTSMESHADSSIVNTVAALARETSRDASNSFIIMPSDNLASNNETATNIAIITNKEELIKVLPFLSTTSIINEVVSKDNTSLLSTISNTTSSTNDITTTGITTNTNDITANTTNTNATNVTAMSIVEDDQSNNDVIVSINSRTLIDITTNTTNTNDIITATTTNDITTNFNTAIVDTVVSNTIIDLEPTTDITRDTNIINTTTTTQMIEDITKKEALDSLRKAVQWLHNPPYIINGKLVLKKNQYTTSDNIFIIPDLPALKMIDMQIRWACTLFRDVSIQALLRKQFALSLKDHILTALSSKGLGPVFIHNDMNCRRLFQLCQISLTFADQIDPIDERVLRYYIPLLVYYLYDDTVDIQDSTITTTTNSNSSSSNNITNTIAMEAQRVVNRVVTFMLDKGDQNYIQTCFNDINVLKEFLESIARYLLNMKLIIN